MPCMDGGPTAAEMKRYREEMAIVTRLACERCRWYEAQPDLNFEVPAWAQEWWSRHCDEDWKREQALREETDRQARRATALGKLTAEERRALGVVDE